MHGLGPEFPTVALRNVRPRRRSPSEAVCVCGGEGHEGGVFPEAGVRKMDTELAWRSGK